LGPRGSSPARASWHSGLWQASYTCVPLSSSSITWYWSKGGDDLRPEGDRRSGDTLAMHHKPSGLPTYGLKANNREMSTRIGCHGSMDHFTLP